jgi:hypothetical protein
MNEYYGMVVISAMGDILQVYPKTTVQVAIKKNLRLLNANHPAYCIREQSKPSLAHFLNPIRLITMQ